MIEYVVFATLITLAALFFYGYNRKHRKATERIKESLNDETIYVEGLGHVEFEDLGEMAQGDPEAGVKYTKDTMFREDLMQFEGPFFIAGLALNEERRVSIDDAFLYLQELFGKDTIVKKPVLTIHDPIFPAEIKDLSEIIPIARTIAEIMDIDPDSIEIGFFQGATPAEPGTFDSSDKNKAAAGLYYGKNEVGKYSVTLADNMHPEPELLISTIAHEFAHIKLLGEERMDENSEELTDMLPLFYGLGLFNSNTVFKFSRDNEKWSTNTLGYLSQVDWAYLFALYRYVRQEENPEWLEYLNKTIAKDCRAAYDFILANPDKVLQPPN